MSKILEIACFNLDSALIAQEAGADRIELCENYLEGGLSPIEELISEARKRIKIPLHVIIRPRSGNFVYSEKEVTEMKKSIAFCKSQKVDGLVFGCLDTERKVDVSFCKELVTHAFPLPVTFHRAIDETENIFKAIQTIIDLGFVRVLSSGAKENAYEGRNTLGILQEKFETKIQIIPGGGIRSANLQEIMQISGCYEFHSAAITDGSDICDAKEIKKLKTMLLRSE